MYQYPFVLIKKKNQKPQKPQNIKFLLKNHRQYTIHGDSLGKKLQVLVCPLVPEITNLSGYSHSD